MSDFVINITSTPPAQIVIGDVDETVIAVSDGITPQDADALYVNMTGDEEINGVKSFVQLPLHSGLPLEFSGNKTDFIDQFSTSSQYPSARSVYELITGYTPTGVDHETLSNLQGGVLSEHQHLTNNELQYLQRLKEIATPNPFSPNLSVSGNIHANGNVFVNNGNDMLATVVSPERTTVTGNGLTSVYAINGAGSLTNPSALIVAIDGAMQEPVTDYTVAAGFITFTSPLASGAKAVVVSPVNTVQVSDFIPSDGSVTSSKLDTNLVINGELSVPNQNITNNGSVITQANILTEKLFGLADVRYRELAYGYTSSGVGSNAAFNSGSNIYNAGTAANGYGQMSAFGLLYDEIGGGTQLQTNVPFTFSFCGGLHLIDLNGSFRCCFGMPLTSTRIPASNQNALSSIGWGFEIFYSTVNSRFEMRLFMHNGSTYTVGSSVPFSVSFGGLQHFIMSSDGAGNLKLYASGVNTNTILPRPSITPICTLSGFLGNTTRYGGIYVSLGGVSHSTLAPSPAGNQGRVTNMALANYAV